MSKHRREVPRGRRVFATATTIAAVAAVVVGGVGVAAVLKEQQPASNAAMSTPVVIPERGRVAPAYREEFVRRAEVVEASRGYARTRLRQAAAEVADAQRGAELRARSLKRLSAAAEARSAELRRELARQRRLAERARQRELARQRRIEEMNRWVVPVSNYEITATFGLGGDLWSSDHTGLDFATAEGSPVGSTAAGEVTSTGWAGAYGNQVVVTHDDGTQTWYCHLSSIYVSPGESVGPGTTIGAVGATGNTTGPHLHLEVRPGGGSPVDPYTYLQEKGAL
jgi:murein DD-endopeptidase MepM/ murein hydrolase activator NlpD